MARRFLSSPIWIRGVKTSPRGERTCRGRSVRGSVNGGETRAGVHVGTNAAVGGPRQVLIDGDKAAGYRTAAALPHRAPRGHAARWIVTAISVIKQ